METKLKRRIGALSFALAFGLMPAHAQLGNLVKTVKSKAEKVVKEVSDDVKNQLDRTPSQAKGAVAQAQKQTPTPDGGDPLTIMRQVQIGELTPDSFYAQARQRDNGGALDQTLDTQAQYETFAYYLLRLKKAVEQRDFETMAWSDDNKAALYLMQLMNNPKREQVRGFRFDGWALEYQKVTAAVDRILMAPFNGSTVRALLSGEELLRRLTTYLQTPGLSMNMKKYYLFQAVKRLSNDLVSGSLQDSNPQVQTIVASLKEIYASMDQEYRSIYPEPRTLEEMKNEQQQRINAQIKKIQDEARERRERVHPMRKAGKMNRPDMLAHYERIMRRVWSKDHIVKMLIVSDDWSNGTSSKGESYRVVNGLMIVKTKDGRYQALPCSMGEKWLPQANRYSGHYEYFGVSDPFYIDYR